MWGRHGVGEPESSIGVFAGHRPVQAYVKRRTLFARRPLDVNVSQGNGDARWVPDVVDGLYLTIL